MDIRRHLFLEAGAVLLWCLLYPGPLSGEDHRLRAWEYEIKAAFLYNFVKFSKWPDAHDPGDAIDIVFLGEDPFGGGLDKALKAKTAHGRPFRIRRERSFRDLRECDVLFLGPRMEEDAAVVLDAVAGRSILTIGDEPELTELGAVITLAVEDRRVRFDLNLAAAKRNDLTLSSHLLRLGRRVIGGGQ